MKKTIHAVRLRRTAGELCGGEVEFGCRKVPWLKTLRILGMVLTAVFLCACTGFKAGEGVQNGGGAAGAVNPGVYEGTGRGFRGPVRVAVYLESGGITDIRIVEHHDDQAVGGAAMEDLLDRILLYNTADLDAISGATESSEGFLDAVENALAMAGPP